MPEIEHGDKSVARNGSGVYSLPGTYTAVSGETIQAQQHNDPLEDLESDANTARPIVAGGTGATTAAAARTALGAAGTGDDNTFTGSNTFSGNVAGIVPSGVVVPFAGSTAPTGWLLADGSTVSRTTYADLFTAIGTTYGAGDGSTTFKLPDLTGRVPAGKEAAATRLTTAGSGIDGGVLGATGGVQNKAIAVGYLPASGVSVTVPETIIKDSGGSNTLKAVISGSAASTEQAGSSDNVYTIASFTDAYFPATTVTSAALGSGTAFPVAQPTIILNFIIKT